MVALRVTATEHLTPRASAQQTANGVVVLSRHYDAVGRLWSSITASVTTISVAICNVRLEIAPNFYDVNLGISYDVKQAGNNYDAVGRLGSSITASVRTISVANYNISAEIAPNSYDVNLGISCDFKSAGNIYRKVSSGITRNSYDVNSVTSCDVKTAGNGQQPVQSAQVVDSAMRRRSASPLSKSMPLHLCANQAVG